MDTIVYLGFNDPRIYKRGVENVIYFQSLNHVFKRSVYIFFGRRNEVFRWRHISCISICDNKFKYIKLNILIHVLENKYVKIFIHSHNVVMSCSLLRKTDLLTVHDAIYYQRKSNGEQKAFVFFVVELFSFLRCKYYHFISNYTKSKSLIRKWTKKQCVIYNTSHFEELKIEMIENPMCKDEFNLFTVRGIQKRTRIDLLIDFADEVKNKQINGKKIHLYIAGKGHLLEKYKKEILCRNIDNITFLGYVDDNTVMNYYYYSNVVIVPCEYAEGFGLPIIEGYYFNKPVIGSNKCAVPEIIINSVFLFDNIIGEMWNCLNRITAYSFNYREYYEDKFSLHHIIREYDLLYRSLLK